MKIRFLAATLAGILLLSVTSGCRKNGSDLSDDSSIDSFSSSYETDSIIDDASSIPSSISGVEGSVSTVTPATDTSGTRFGVTTTKKMPNYISKIKSNTLNVVMSGPENEFTDADKQAFKALTGIDIKAKYETIEWSQQLQRVTAMTMAGKAPDLFYYANNRWPDMLKTPYWSDWNEYIDINDALWKNTADINGDICINNGKRVGLFLPNTGEMMAATLVYNTKMVNEAIDSNPELYDPLDMFYDNAWTWDTLYAFVEEISDAENGIYGIDLPDYAVSKFIASTNQDIIKFNSNGTLTYNLENADVIRALDFAKKIYQISSVSASWQGPEMLLNGTCAFYDYSAGMHLLTARTDIINAVKKGKIKVVPFPRDPQTENYYRSGMDDVAVIPEGASNPWLSAAWMYYKRYSAYNVNKAVKSANEQKYMSEYGWSEDIYALYDQSSYADKFSKVKFVNSPDCIAYGERMADFDQKTYWKMIITPSTLTSQVVATVGPNLKEVIARYNSK